MIEFTIEAAITERMSDVNELLCQQTPAARETWGDVKGLYQ